MKKRAVKREENKFSLILPIAFAVSLVIMLSSIYFSSNISFSPEVSSSVTRSLTSSTGSLSILISDSVDNFLIAEKIPQGIIVSGISPEPFINSNNTLAWYFSSLNSEKVISYSISGTSIENFEGRYGFEYLGDSYEYSIAGDSVIPAVVTSSTEGSSSGGSASGGSSSGGAIVKPKVIVNIANKTNAKPVQTVSIIEKKNEEMVEIPNISNETPMNSNLIIYISGGVLVIVIILVSLLILKFKKRKSKTKFKKVKNEK